MNARTSKQLQAELQALRERVAELEHALEVHEWGGQLFHDSSIPQMLVDFETGTILAVNTAAQQFYGEQLREAHIDCVCAENLRWTRDLREYVHQQRYGVRLSRQHAADGLVHIVEVHYTVVNLRGRTVVHLLCFDVTERERTRRELELSHARYQAFVQLSSEGIYRIMLTEPIAVQLPIERQAELIYERAYVAECNSAYAAIFGKTINDIVGALLRQHCPLERGELVRIFIQFIRAGYQLVRRQLSFAIEAGNERHYEYSLRGILQDGYVHGAWGVIRDITELVQTQRSLQASEERYRLFVQLANEGIWRVEATEPIPVDLPVEEQVQRILQVGYLAECNRAFARMYGAESPEALIGAPIANLLVPSDPQNVEMLRAFVANNYRLEGTVSHERAADGSERYFLNSFFGVVENGALVRAWGIQTDITELRQMQQQLEQAYRLESIGRIAGGIAHDFNNVLTAVIGFAELARSRSHDETLNRYLDGIIQAAERAANLNRQLLAYARKQVVQLTYLNVGEWLESTLEMLRRVLPETITLRTEIAPNLWLVHADPNLLLQVVLNLVVNARDAMPDGGVITLRVRNRTIRRSRPSAVPNGEYVALAVSDTGTGIPPEVLPHIFEPFFTTKPSGHGTGMGLAAVQGAVQQLRGYIEVQTKVGAGTTFTVYLPRIAARSSG